ncbi:MAG: c-type cytochrome [Planctomycetes bacterium]|nr:c-type cytochrome [Planctomycetota bacterium]
MMFLRGGLRRRAWLGCGAAVVTLGATALVVFSWPPANSRAPAQAAPDEGEVIAAAPLQITPWAEAPLVRNPASIDVDDRGRVWVAEAVNYRDWVNGQSESSSSAHRPQGDRIVILSDTDGDGRADDSTVFAQDPELVAPMGLCVLGRSAYVSCSPHVLVYTDDDGDDRADRKDVFLTGFGGFDNDHGVHSLVPGPDGAFYLVTGNAGPHVVTDRSGWTLRAGSYYPSPPSTTLNSGGLRSDDGEVHVGGVALKVGPDGRGLSVIGHNFRNPYELAVDSFGDVWQTDNDDTVSCRMTWLMERANLGFASADGRRSWQEDSRPGQTVPEAHWRQDDPGVLPAGDVYGTGAPTGLVRYEGDALGPNLQGAIIACEAGLGCVFAYTPIPDGAGFRFESKRLIWSQNPEKPYAETWFRPTDVAISPEGDLLISDWFDPNVGGHRIADLAAGGRIFRVTPTRKGGAKQDLSPASSIDLSTPQGRRAALRSVSPHVRWMGRKAIANRGAAAVEELEPLLTDPNPFVQARALWVLAEAGPEGKGLVEARLHHDDPQMRIAAFRAMRAAGVSAVELAPQVCVDPSPAVRREAAIALRGAPYAEARPFLLELAARFDGSDRTYLEALGAACEAHAEFLYPDLKSRFGAPAGEWSAAFSGLVWRLHPRAALEDLRAHAHDPRLDERQRRRMIDALAFTQSEQAPKAIASLAKALWKGDLAGTQGAAELRQYAEWWLGALSEVSRAEGGRGADAGPITVRTPPRSPTIVDHARVAAIADRSGNRERGRQWFFSERAGCASCHRFSGKGGDAGPELTEIRRRLNRRQLVEAILYPSASIASGYNTWTATDIRGRTYAGALVSTADIITLRTAGGAHIDLPRRQVEELGYLPVSLMPDFGQGALSSQAVADLAEFLLQANN